MNYDEENATQIWVQAVRDILTEGREVTPRGQPTREIPHRTVTVNMRQPVVCAPARKLSYQFMAAEAHWILSGSNRVDDIAPYSKHINQFSDNGETFFGAYGPKIIQQLPYVLYSLTKDRDTRQAGLTIWRESPPVTKDVPCTVCIFFNIRNNYLNCHIFMRSSDVWLGLPYDVFNFSMLSHYICGYLNDSYSQVIRPGRLHLTAMSAHLYERDRKTAEACLQQGITDQLPTPEVLFKDHRKLMIWLKALRDTRPGDKLRWWEVQDAPHS